MGNLILLNGNSRSGGCMNEWNKSIATINPKGFSVQSMNDGKFELAGLPLNLYLGLATVRLYGVWGLAQGSKLQFEVNDPNYDYIFHVDGDSFKARGGHVFEVSYDCKINVLKYYGN